MDLAAIRNDYRRGTLRRGDLHADPVLQFQRWMEEAIAGGVVEPTAMSLATVAHDGSPYLRTVLLKGLDRRQGFLFFTNLGSRKAVQIEEHAMVSLLFPWLALERQVMVVGRATLLSRADVEAYFISRPRESRLAAWASHQSSELADRAALEAGFAKAIARFGADGPVPVPPFWGGYGVVPSRIEFWQGGSHRMHDRFEYRRGEDEAWTIHRLSP
ncbi:MAG TPA: pyridoxamine 5'-phosphate oxidase [Chthoniobacteraceae bacterium]|nr:pyridoxamine 5'-phosphate oxidase [Chthoniobacteraceae bacterium]